MKFLYVILGSLFLCSVIGCGKFVKCADANTKELCIDKGNFENERECEWVTFADKSGTERCVVSGAR